MEKESTNLDLITKYLDGEIPEEALQAFNKAMEQEDFLEEATFYQDMVTAVRSEGAKEQDKLLEEVDLSNINQDIRAKLVAQNKRLTQHKTGATGAAKVSRLVPIRRLLSLAASVLVLVVAGFWYAKSNFSTTALSTNNYLAADIPGTMGGNNTTNVTFQEGLNAFWVQKDLATAKTIFEKIPSTNLEFVEAQYFLGHIAFKEQDYPKAIQQYQQVLSANQLPNFINRDKLTWNLLLARLGTGENIDTELTTILENENSPLYEQAKQLKAQMNSFWVNWVFSQ